MLSIGDKVDGYWISTSHSDRSLIRFYGIQCCFHSDLMRGYRQPFVTFQLWPWPKRGASTAQSPFTPALSLLRPFTQIYSCHQGQNWLLSATQAAHEKLCIVKINKQWWPLWIKPVLHSSSSTFIIEPFPLSFSKTTKTSTQGTLPQGQIYPNTLA